jgi:GTP cyclohydrolase II
MDSKSHGIQPTASKSSNRYGKRLETPVTRFLSSRMQFLIDTKRGGRRVASKRTLRNRWPNLKVAEKHQNGGNGGNRLLESTVPMKTPRNSPKARVVAHAKLPTSFGKFKIAGIEGRNAKEEAVAVFHGQIDSAGNGHRPPRARKAPLVRVHSQCLTGDVFASQRCDCRAQLEFSLEKIAKEPSGVLLYLPQEGRGIGLINKLKAYELQDEGLDTVEANRKLGFEADSRDYEFAAEALKALGIREVRLLSNNPDKVAQLEKAGVRVIERVPCRPPTSRHSKAYLRTKRKKLGHLLADV